MQTFPPDLEGAKALKWAPYAGRNITFFFTYTHLRDTYGKLYEKWLGIRFAYIFVEAKGSAWQMFRSPTESERLESFVYEKTKDPLYVQDVLKKTGQAFKTYREHAKRQFEKKYMNASSEELVKAMETEHPGYWDMIAGISCSIIFASALARRLQEKIPEEAVARLALPLYRTLPLEEEIAFQKLVKKIKDEKVVRFSPTKEDPLSTKAQKALQDHYNKFCWLDAYENDPIWKKTDLIQRVNEALSLDPRVKLEEIEKRQEANEKLVFETAKEYGVEKEQLKLFRLAMYYRILGESLMGLANYSTIPLFTAIAKKLVLPRNQIKWFSDEELIGALEGKIRTEELDDRLAKRQKRYLVALGDKEVHAFEGDLEVQDVLDQLDIDWPKEEKVSEVKGVSAYPGLVQGIARVVRHVGELDKVKQGDILVTLNTTPSFILAMKRSAAIVTDEGGITCHAAIVSRELGIPCIIGTKAGTRLIQDGAKVEVDAAKGTVKNLEE